MALRFVLSTFVVFFPGVHYLFTFVCEKISKARMSAAAWGPRR